MKTIAVSAFLVSMALLSACGTESDTNASASGHDDGEIDAAERGTDLLALDTEAGEGISVVYSEGSATSFKPECVIAESGVAGIDFPATLGAFVEAFPSGTALSFQPAYMVDFGALCALSGGEEAICVIFESYEVEDYRADIETVAMGVYADQCQTAEGVGPGTSIDDAVAAYGAARFGFSYDNEGREYVSFADAPSVYSFRAESAAADAIEGDALRASGRHGGDYNGVQGDSYFETVVAQPDAKIWEIWLSTPH